MRITRRGKSQHIEDRRGRAPSRGVAIGGGIGIPAVLIALVASLCTGGGGSVDLGQILEETLGGQVAPPAAPGSDITADAPDPDADLVEFVSFVLDDVQAFWDAEFAAASRDYAFSTLVLYEQGTNTGCGYGQAAAGPFYCPADQNVYLDLSFFRQLASRFDAPGDFAQAYVIAHEIAHHVQGLLGISSSVRQEQAANPQLQNDLSIRLELQADCLAGVWGFSAFDRDLLEPGDLEEGIGAAAAVGDDAIQSSAGGEVRPETWTHGSSEQRVRWFRVGYDNGDPNLCDTFGGDV